MSFEWQTEEDEQPAAIPLAPAPETAVSPRKSRWLLWGALLGLVILAGWLVYRQANARTKTAVSQTKTALWEFTGFCIVGAGLVPARLWATTRVRPYTP